MQAQSQIEQTLKDFDAFKKIKNEIVDIQAKMLEKQKVFQTKQALIVQKEAKNNESMEVLSAYNKSSGYAISIQDSLK